MISLSDLTTPLFRYISLIDLFLMNNRSASFLLFSYFVISLCNFILPCIHSRCVDALDIRTIGRFLNFYKYRPFLLRSLFTLPTIIFKVTMNSSINDRAVSSTPSSSSFEKQAELAREALQNFNTIRVLNAPAAIKGALNELVHATVRAFLF